MSGFFNKIWPKVITIIVIVLLAIGFKELIYTDTSVSAFFGELMGNLPFSKKIVEVICKIMKYQQSVPLITSSSLISDLLKLAIMACIQPLIVGLFSWIFLKVPNGSSFDMEKHMSKTSYRIGELFISVLLSPLCALVAANLTAAISNYLTTKIGGLLSSLIGVLAVILISCISIIPLLYAGMAIGKALLWRVLITLLGKMVTTLGTNICCLWLYVAILGGLQSQVLSSILVLIFWLIMMDIIIRGLQSVIVSS